MTIHSEHPFQLPRDQRDAARRLRGLMPAPVSIWTSEACGQQDGWTISSMMIADGEPAEIVALVDEDCDWWEIFSEAELACVNILGPGQGGIADVFARMAGVQSRSETGRCGGVGRSQSGDDRPRT